jgi:hypothetical protein
VFVTKPMNGNAYATLARALEELARRGFTERFQVVDGGVRALGRAETMKSKDLVIKEYYRFEGISDPDDMAILYAMESVNGVRGTLADASACTRIPGSRRCSRTFQSAQTEDRRPEGRAARAEFPVQGA